MTKKNDIAVEAEEAKEVETSYGFYSKLLEKPFDTLTELKEAESAYKKAEEEKAAKALAKKADATKVEDAFKAVNAARREYINVRTEVSKAYAKAVAEAKRLAQEQLDKAQAVVDDAETAYSEALHEFNVNHPEGFHLTLRDDQTGSVATISQNSSNLATIPMLDPFKDLADFFKGFIF